MKALRAWLAAWLVCSANGAFKRNLDCEVCQTLVYDSQRRIQHAPKSSITGTKLAMLVLDVMNGACYARSWEDYANKARLNSQSMMMQCTPILAAIEEQLEEALQGGHVNETQLRHDLCLKQLPDSNKKKHKHAKPQAVLGYCEERFMWKAHDMPHLRLNLGEINLREGKAFLEKKAKKKGVISLASEVMYKVLTSGNGTIHPTPEDKVSVHYNATLTNGTLFASSYKRKKEYTFKVSSVVTGWKEAIQLMVQGDVWEVYLPEHLAYGKEGSMYGVGPHAAIIIQVELLGVVGKDYVIVEKKADPKKVDPKAPEKAKTDKKKKKKASKTKSKNHNPNDEPPKQTATAAVDTEDDERVEL